MIYSNACSILLVSESEYPAALVTAQRELDDVRAQLAALYERLPWSVQPADGFSDVEIWRPRVRPASPGWPEDDQAAVGRLRAREVDLAARVVTDPYWQTIDTGARHAARMALKHL